MVDGISQNIVIENLPVTGAIIGGILGSAVGAAVPLIYARRHSKTERTLIFFREFSSKEMSQTRSEASLYLEKHLHCNLHGENYDSAIEKASIPVWTVARFYHSLWINIDHGEVRPRMTASLFGSIFIWWHLVYLKDALHPSWQISTDLMRFSSWLPRFAGADFIDWQDEAVKDRVRREAALSSIR